MRNNFYNDDLEHYLEKQANQHRMYPSDHIWRNINKEVHGHKKWPALSAITVCIIAALVVTTLINKPEPDVILSANYTFALPSSPNKIQKDAAQGSHSNNRFDDHLLTEQITKHTIAAAKENMKIQAAIANQQLPNVQFDEPLFNNAQLANAKTVDIKLPDSKLPVIKERVSDELAANEISEKAFSTFKSKLKSQIFYTASLTSNNMGSTQTYKSSYNHTYLPEIMYSSEETYMRPRLDRLKEKSSRFDLRVYVTPSVSYRRMKEVSTTENANKAAADKAIVPYASNYKIDPDEAIRHRPALGYETGVALGYKLNNKFSLTGGFQFNISRYKVDAYIYHQDASALNENGTEEQAPSLSSLRSIPGSTPITLTNRYYELSIPVGVDWKAWTNEKITWGVAASVQPSYTFDKEPLILNSEFKNYTDGSDLIRNWNLNTNLETYVGYSIGSYRWQIGPQFRYQLLPTLTNNYPIKEHLINYGLKLGVVKTLK